MISGVRASGLPDVHILPPRCAPAIFRTLPATAPRSAFLKRELLKLAPPLHRDGITLGMKQPARLEHFLRQAKLDEEPIREHSVESIVHEFFLSTGASVATMHLFMWGSRTLRKYERAEKIKRTYSILRQSLNRKLRDPKARESRAVKPEPVRVEVGKENQFAEREETKRKN